MVFMTNLNCKMRALVASLSFEVPANGKAHCFQYATLGSAAVELGLDCFEPFDLDQNPAHNILDDTAFEALLKLCWAGAAALIMLASPCKEYSRLKLRPGGPKALRTPQHTHSAPGLSPCQQKKLADSKAIHERGRLLFTAVVSEQPPLSMS